jgi:hypothetical protein
MCSCPKCKQFRSESQFCLFEHLWFAHFVNPFEALEMAKKVYRKHVKKV